MHTRRGEIKFNWDTLAQKCYINLWENNTSKFFIYASLTFWSNLRNLTHLSQYTDIKIVSSWKSMKSKYDLKKYVFP